MESKIALLKEYASTYGVPPPVKYTIDHNGAPFKIGCFWLHTKRNSRSVDVLFTLLENPVLRADYLRFRREQCVGCAIAHEECALSHS